MAMYSSRDCLWVFLAWAAMFFLVHRRAHRHAECLHLWYLKG